MLCFLSIWDLEEDRPELQYQLYHFLNYMSLGKSINAFIYLWNKSNTICLPGIF